MTRKTVKIIGDGKTPQTAFRADTTKPYRVVGDIPTDTKGKPINNEAEIDEVD